MSSSLELQSRIPLSYMLGFDPGNAYYRVMAGIRERVLQRSREQRLIYQYGPRIFPEEFEGYEIIVSKLETEEVSK